MNVPIRALYPCFLLSGASALIYQVVWERMLTLVFGLSTLSVAAVLSAFLGGMALGARLLGPLADRTAQPLRLYALVEAGIALAGLATLGLIPLVMHVFAGLYAAIEPGYVGSNLIRFALALVAVGGASLLIGATVPIMARLLSVHAGSTAVGFASGYSVNTAGSVLGALLAGFFLIRLVGTQNALLCAVAGNLAAFAIALWAARRVGQASAQQPPRGAAPQTETAVSAASEASPGVPPTFVLALAAVTGALALAYEVAWIRLLAIFTLNSVYVFTMVVSTYLVALSLGAAAAMLLLRWRRVRELPVLAVCQLLLALIVPILLALAPAASQLELRTGTRSEAAIFWTEYALTAAIVFFPTLLVGVGLPVLVSLASRSVADAGRTVGRVYAWNAVGTIMGAALTGAVIIPALGLRGCLMLLAAINLAIVAAAMLAERSPAGWSRGVTPAGAAAFALLVALVPGATRFYVPADVPGETVLYYAEGPSATVHVAEYELEGRRHRTLFVDSKSVAGTYPEIVTDQKMLAHLPLLLHPAPQRALTVGFGTGGTSYSMLLHRVRVECVEIEPRVADAFRYFESENRGLVGPEHDRSEFRLVLDDARAWLHVAPEPYDVIVTDLTSIQYRGNGNLYTAECFRLMQSQLRPGGIGAAWVPITGITSEALRVLVRTFQSVFPNTSVWYAINLPTDFVILVGTPRPLELRLDDAERRMAAPMVRRDLAIIGLDNPYKLAACLLLAGPDVARFAGAGPLHTDDRPILDYMTHATPYHNTLPANLSALAAVRSDAAAYVTAWPGAATKEPGAAWRTWRAASDHLITGHIAVRSPDAEGVHRARAAYAEALALVPDDEQTQALVQAVSPTP